LGSPREETPETISRLVVILGPVLSRPSSPGKATPHLRPSALKRDPPFGVQAIFSGTRAFSDIFSPSAIIPVRVFMAPLWRNGDPVVGVPTPLFLSHRTSPGVGSPFPSVVPHTFCFFGEFFFAFFHFLSCPTYLPPVCGGGPSEASPSTPSSGSNPWTPGSLPQLPFFSFFGRAISFSPRRTNFFFPPEVRASYKTAPSPSSTVFKIVPATGKLSRSTNSFDHPIARNSPVGTIPSGGKSHFAVWGASSDFSPISRHIGLGGCRDDLSPDRITAVFSRR